MKDLQKTQINGSDEPEIVMQLGCAIGAYTMLKKLEPALSDGTRHGSPECASQLQQLSQVKQEITSVIVNSLGALGITVSTTPPNIQPVCIEHKT